MYNQWKTNEQKTVKTLCNLIVKNIEILIQIFLFHQVQLMPLHGSMDKEQYGEMTDDEKYYTETRGGVGI